MTARTYAQSMSNYGTPVRSTGIIYNSIEYSGNAVYSWRNFSSSTEDDNRSYAVPIGFDFYYCGRRYTTFSASTNGFLDFSSSTRDGGPGIDTRAAWAFGPYDQDLSTSTRSAPSTDAGTVLAIAPFYYDLTTQGESDPLGGSIKYLVTGTAPYRCLTVEWMRMAIWTNTTPNFNFQVKLYETTGRIEMVYSTMTQGTFNWASSPTTGYTVGMSGPVIGATPTAAQVWIQQAANSTTFGAGRQNDLRTVPASNSMLQFTPPTPAAPSALAFTGVTSTQMTLSWTDNATNDVGYVIYASDDGGATYNFVRQLAPGVASSAEQNLVPGTTYNWRVSAITEGALSAPLSGSMATTAPNQFISARTGNWGTGSTWIGGTVPDNYGDIIINNGHTVTVNQNIFVSGLTVGQGGGGALVIGSSNTDRTLTIAGDIDIRDGASVTVANTNAAHQMLLSGNVANAGTLNLALDANSVCDVTFRRQGPQAVSGTGAVTKFNLITLAMGATNDNILDVSAVNFSAAANFLTLQNGTFNLAAPATVTPFTAAATIPITAGLSVNNASAVVNTTGGSLNVNGELSVHAGRLNVGSAANQHLVSHGGRVVFDGGTANVAGGFMPKDNYTITDFTMANAAVVTLNTLGSTSTVYAPFHMSVSGSKFTQTGGTLVIQQKGGGAGNEDLAYTNYFYSVHTVTGGTLQLGNASTPAGQTMRVKSGIPVYSLTVYNGSVTGQLDTYPLTVKGNVTIGGGTLTANALDMTVAGAWTNTGSFNPTTANVTFNGTGIQTLSRTGGEAFNRLTVAKAAGSLLALGSTVSVANAFALTTGTLAVGAHALTLNGPVTGGGVLTSAATGTVNYNQAADNQTVLLANYGSLNFSAFAKTLPSTGVLGIAGSFTSGRASGHTITGSTVAFNGTGVQSVSPFTFNNLQLVTGGTKTFTAGADTVRGDLTIASGVHVNTAAAVYAFRNIANDGTHTGTGVITLTGGAAAHALSGTGTYGNLVLNDASGATIAGDLLISGQLSLTAGVITPLGAQTVVIASPTGVVRTSGWVNGPMRRVIGAGTASVFFDIGDAANYTPAVFGFSNVMSAGGSVTARAVQGDHPQLSGSAIDPTHSVNRYWSVTASGMVFDSASIQFAWMQPGDVDVPGLENRYIVGRYAGGAWDTVRADLRTSGFIRATGIASFGEFAVGFDGNANAYRTKGNGAGTGAWNATTIWQYYNAPTNSWRDTTAYPVAANAGLITIQDRDVVTVPLNIAIDQTLVQSGAQLVITGGQTLTLLNGSGTDLTVAGMLRNAGNDIAAAAGTAVVFTNGSTYRHERAGGTIPAAVWGPTSTCEVRGATTAAPAQRDQVFGNFVWNSASQTGAVNLNNAPHTVAGRYTIAGTGTGSVQLFGTGSAQTLSIAGSLAVLGGTVTGIDASSQDDGTIAVGDSLIIAGGIFTLSARNGDRVNVDVAGEVRITGGTLRLTASSTTDVVTVKRNFTHIGGTIDQTSTGRGSIVFNGTAPQVYTSGGTVTGRVDFTVAALATLVMGTNILTGGGTFSLQDGGTIALGSPAGIASTGATGNIQVTGTRTFGTAAQYIYNGVQAQVTGSGLPAAARTLTIDNAAGATLIGSVAVTDTLSLVNGSFNIGANTLTLNNIAQLANGSLLSGTTGTVIYNRAADGQPVIRAAYGNLTFSNFRKLLPPVEIRIAGTFTPGTATGHTVTGDTINYNGGAQTIAAFTYDNLTTSGGGLKRLAYHCTVLGNLSLMAGTFADTGYTVTVNGNVTNNAVHTGAGRILLTLGAAVHSLSGTGTYMNLEVNDGPGAVLASNDLEVKGVLSLTTGIIATGSNAVVIGSGGSIWRAANANPRHIFGTIRKPVPVNPGTQTITFETGDAANYSPAECIFNSVTAAGALTATAVSGAHPNIGASGIDPATYASRYWTLTNTGIAFTTCSVNLTFVASDLVPASTPTSAFFIKRYSGSGWSLPTIASRGSVSIRANGLTAFGDFVIGELTDKFHWSGLAGNHLWNDANNWNLINVPTSTNDVILDGPATDSISVNVGAACRNFDLTNAGFTVTILPGQSLAIGGTASMSNGRLFTQNLLPSVTGSITITGGTIGYNGAGAQTVAQLPYHHLVIGGTGAKAAAGAFTVSGDLAILAGAMFTTSGAPVTLNGNWTNNGTYMHGGSTVILAGTQASAVTGATTFAGLQVNKQGAGTVVTLASNMQAAALIMTQGRMETGPNSITVTSERTGNGIVIGTITRTHAFTAGIAYAFEGPNNLITFTGGSLPTSVTETVTLASPGANADMDPVNRSYTLAMTGGSGYVFAYRLHYETGEIPPPNFRGTLALWQEQAPAGSNVWALKGVSAADSTGGNYVELNGITPAGMGRWTLSSPRPANMVLMLAQDKEHPAPGEQVIYTITWKNNDGYATNSVITAIAPFNTTYVPNSVFYGGVSKTDAADADGVTLSGGILTVNINTLIGNVPVPPFSLNPATGTGTITYKVTIN